MIDREQMLKIMDETGALDHLDINETDFLDGHHRASVFTPVIEAAYTLGRQEVEAFAKAAARHATTDGVDQWNAMVDAWDALPEAMQRELLA